MLDDSTRRIGAAPAESGRREAVHPHVFARASGHDRRGRLCDPAPWTAIKLSKGRVVKGHKIGLTSRAMQSAVGIDEPDYGVLYTDMFWNDDAVIPFEKYLSARIEMELAFVLAKPLAGPNCTIFDVLDSTSYVTPALEILESRIHRLDPETKATRKVTDTIADNAANAAIVTGGRPFRPQDVDLRWISPVDVRKGDTFHADYGVYGSVSCHFA